ncbi:MAG: methyltransferase domain-containing protein [Candidatus Dojkabacteria bacterium]|nr:methyltransferase domain-containing protein [Candidatus Dojkabacteria bacterium]
MKQEIVNYDGYDYDYSTYWKDRQYENISEHYVLNKFLNNERGEWFIDIGGSYGRLADCYAGKFQNAVIIDYSLKTLQKNYQIMTDKYPNLILIAANAYKLPFKNSSFDGGLMVRVLHHIDKQKEYFKEVARILKNDGVYIQEFANKKHIKARVKAILHRDKEINSLEPYQQPTINLEGAKGDGVPFLNYHSKYIENLLKEEGFQLEKKQGCSYFRIPLLKKIFGTKILVILEKVFQHFFAKTDISPSIFFKERLHKKEKSPAYIRLDDLLVCPSCKHEMIIDKTKAVCTNCKKEYFKKDNIWDFRTE